MMKERIGYLKEGKRCKVGNRYFWHRSEPGGGACLERERKLIKIVTT